MHNNENENENENDNDVGAPIPKKYVLFSFEKNCSITFAKYIIPFSFMKILRWITILIFANTNGVL